MELSERKKAILKAIIQDYIETAAPVGSRTISRKYLSGISPATIRNEMSDLEEMGLLLQPHTSAGRVPSQQAYRLYVDRLMEAHPLDPEEAQAIRQYVQRHMDEMEEVVKRTAYVISDLTKYTALVLSPQLRRTTLRRIQLVYLSRGTALVVIVTNVAVAKDAIIRIPDGLDEEDLAVISRTLTERFAGQSITDINLGMLPGLMADFAQQRDFFSALMTALEDSVMTPSRGDLVMDGTINIFNYPEYQDVEKASHFLSALQAHEALYRMLAKRTKWEYTITIGEENADEELRDCSVVTATYRMGNRPMGSIGVIGPMRMNYPRVVQVLSFMSHNLGAMFENRNHPEE